MHPATSDPGRAGCRAKSPVIDLRRPPLQAFLEENPRDADVLRHDTRLAPRQIKPHLKHLPDYLVPKGTEVARGKKKKDVSKFAGAKAVKAKARRLNDPLRGGKKKK